jgi:hypothetical protein
MAEGGKSIAAATRVVYGQQEFGNTATSAFQPGSCGWGGEEDAYRSFWSMGVLAGDQVTVDWESSAPDTEIKLAPIGTTDYNLFQVTLAAEESLSGNGKNELQYTSPQTGILPLYFRICGATPGPYDFIATDQHAVVTALAPRLHIPTATTVSGTASLADGTPVPDGMAFTLTAKWSSQGLAQFTATSIAGTLDFPVALPPEAAGRNVTLTITRPADTQYLAAKSTSLKVGVARPKPAPRPVRRHHRHRHRHHHHRHHRHRR